MSEQVNASLIKETQDVLSKYVKKPPLSEKLLRKPPFRYLHDIITAVINETGVLDGVFTAEELSSNNVKDKESKIAFLNKLISAVKKLSGTNVTVRAAKIVAGLEVNKTLELLHTIGKAIDEKVDTTKNIAQPLEPKNAEIQNTQKSDEKEKKPNEKNIEGDSNESKKNPEKINVSRTNKQPTQKVDARKNSIEKSDKPKNETTNKNASESTGRGIKAATNSDAKSAVPTKPSVKRNSISSKSTPVRRPSLRNNKQNSINSKPLQAVIKEEKEESNDIVDRNKGIPEKDTKTERKNSQPTIESKPRKEQDNRENGKVKENDMTEGNAKNAHSLPNDEEKQEKSPVKRRESIVQRPGSARPGSRKLIHDNEQSKTTPKETAEVNGNDPKNQIPSSVRPRTANRPASARPGAPRIRDRGEVAAVEEPTLAVAPVNVIEEGKQDQFMDDRDSFIVIETEKAPLQTNDMVDETEQGQLVHQILKTQKELNESVAADKSQNKQLQIEWEAGRQAEKDLVSEEIEKIRKSIQVLTSAANPLGKLFDFLQEDVDEMQRELQHWKNVNEKLRKQQKSELELGKTLLQPLQKQLSDVENSIEEEYLQIANIKMTVLNNDEKILKLATNNGSKSRIK